MPSRPWPCFPFSCSTAVTAPGRRGFPRCRPGRVADLRHPYLACQGPDGSPVCAGGFITGIDRVAALFAQHMVGLGAFEFLPVLLMVVLMVPFAGQRFGRLRRFARQGWAVFLAMIAAILVTALFSPSPSAARRMRTCATSRRSSSPEPLVTAVCLVILWDLSRPLACLAAILVVMTNALTLSWVAVPQIPLRSTLLSYIAEGHRITGRGRRPSWRPSPLFPGKQGADLSRLHDLRADVLCAGAALLLAAHGTENPAAGPARDAPGLSLRRTGASGFHPHRSRRAGVAHRPVRGEIRQGDVPPARLSPGRLAGLSPGRRFPALLRASASAA
ncbi:MAG: hypothetical protein MZV70_75695 [Desulfobacterales bacterium]|nr:hypothetical protein [Desulfobacterales bacterium]